MGEEYRQHCWQHSEFPPQPLQSPCGADSKGKIFLGQIKWQHQETRTVLWLCIHFPPRTGRRRPIQCVQPARQPSETCAFPPGWMISISAQRLQTLLTTFQIFLNTDSLHSLCTRDPQNARCAYKQRSSKLRFHRNRSESQLPPPPPS